MNNGVELKSYKGWSWLESGQLCYKKVWLSTKYFDVHYCAVLFFNAL